MAGSTALPLKRNGQTEKLTAGTAPSLEDITASPRLTNSPKGSGQINATSALLSAPGCGVGAPRAPCLTSTSASQLPRGLRQGESRDQPPPRHPRPPHTSSETPPRECALGLGKLGLGGLNRCLASESVRLVPSVCTTSPAPPRPHAPPGTTSGLSRCTGRSIITRLFILGK